MKGKRTVSDYFEVAPGVWGLKDILVNIYMIQDEEDYSWVLLDTGFKSSYSKIKNMAVELLVNKITRKQLFLHTAILIMSVR
ncbi:hypothetical protein [Dyadobacter sp. NIV53]|uniref:hypothetical protein n=1 Tax=Dyadobacter sp. NIV53 TaxID=2861765 RepID=UPI001C876544|nr:hypothetical protein [Dyadobacter sp. NIV53]